MTTSFTARKVAASRAKVAAMLLRDLNEMRDSFDGSDDAEEEAIGAIRSETAEALERLGDALDRISSGDARGAARSQARAIRSEREAGGALAHWAGLWTDFVAEMAS